MFLSLMLFMSITLIILVIVVSIIGISIGLIYKKKGEIEENEE
jgi:uncharacterized membrane protein